MCIPDKQICKNEEREEYTRNKTGTEEGIEEWVSQEIVDALKMLLEYKVQGPGYTRTLKG